MINPVPDLCGVPYEWGVNDCFTAAQRYYATRHNIIIKDYARPDKFWLNGLDLIMGNFRKEGFELIDIPLHELNIGDGFLIAVGTTFPTHCAVYVGGGQIFHHFTKQLSTVEAYTGIWRKYTLAMVRHPGVAASHMDEVKTVQMLDLVPPHLREKINDITPPASAQEES